MGLASRSGEPRALNFHEPNEGIDETIGTLIDLAGGIQRPAIVREMIIAALKAGQEDLGQVDLKLMNSTLKEMRFTAKVFQPYQGIRKVSVFGSARTPSEDPIYQAAHDLGRALADAGFMVITGGGPGIMQAANEGAGPSHSFGVNIRLPFEQQANPVLQNNPRNVTYKYFFNRKVAFLKEADAVVLFPGGFGTLDEGMETLTLLQTGKRSPIPVILFDAHGSDYWDGWEQFIRTELIDSGYVSAPDVHLYDRMSSITETVALIQRFYCRYHSIRFVGDQLVIRLGEPLTADAVSALAEEFVDLLIDGGGIRSGNPLPAEQDEPAVAHLPRLVVDFNRHHFSRLRQLIDRINAVE